MTGVGPAETWKLSGSSVVSRIVEFYNFKYIVCVCVCVCVSLSSLSSPFPLMDSSEDIEENPFYWALQQKHGALWSQVEQNGYTVCVPSANSIHAYAAGSTMEFQRRDFGRFVRVVRCRATRCDAVRCGAVRYVELTTEKNPTSFGPRHTSKASISRSMESLSRWREARSVRGRVCGGYGDGEV